jgi:predicted RNA-binding protein with PUA-like domain
MLRDEIAKGDRVFLYHSSCDVPGIVGIAKVTREGYPDHTQFDPSHDHYDPDSRREEPRWYMVDVALEKRFAREIKLETLRAHARRELDGLLLLRAGNRLSVMPVSEAHWNFILTLA